MAELAEQGYQLIDPDMADDVKAPTKDEHDNVHILIVTAQ